MNTNELKQYKTKLKLTDQQRHWLVGLMLGDGHLETQNQGRTYRLKIEHSAGQKDYVDWLYQQFKDWVTTPPQLKRQTINTTLYLKYYFNTVSHAAFRFYARQFYQRGKKVVPKQIQHWLTPAALAVWYMDDGSLKSSQHRARILNTQGFTKREVSRLTESLRKQFGLKTQLRKQPEGYQILIGGESYDELCKLLQPYIILSMRYKLAAPHSSTQKR